MAAPTLPWYLDDTRNNINKAWSITQGKGATVQFYDCHIDTNNLHLGLAGKVSGVGAINPCAGGAVDSGTMHAGAVAATFMEYDDGMGGKIAASGVAPLAKIKQDTPANFPGNYPDCQDKTNCAQKDGLSYWKARISGAVPPLPAVTCANAYNVKLNAQVVFINFDDLPATVPPAPIWDNKFQSAGAAAKCSTLKENNILVVTSGGYKKEHINDDGKSQKIHPDLFDPACRENVLIVGSETISDLSDYNDILAPSLNIPLLHFTPTDSAGNYFTLDAGSPAATLAAGVATLIASSKPALSASGIRKAILDEATDQTDVSIPNLENSDCPLPMLILDNLCTAVTCKITSCEALALVFYLNGKLHKPLQSSDFPSVSDIGTYYCNPNEIIPNLPSISYGAFGKISIAITPSGDQEVRVQLVKRDNTLITTQLNVASFTQISSASITSFRDQSVLIGWSVKNDQLYHLILYFVLNNEPPFLSNVPLASSGDFKFATSANTDNKLWIAYTDSSTLYVKELEIINDNNGVRVAQFSQAKKVESAKKPTIHALNANSDGSINVVWQDSIDLNIWSQTYDGRAFSTTLPIDEKNYGSKAGPICEKNEVDSIGNCPTKMCSTETQTALFSNTKNRIMLTPVNTCLAVEITAKLAGEGGANSAVKITNPADSTIVAFGKSIQENQRLNEPEKFKLGAYKSIATIIASYLQLHSATLKPLSDLTFIPSNLIMLPPLYITKSGIEQSSETGVSVNVDTLDNAHYFKAAGSLRKIRIASLPILFQKLGAGAISDVAGGRVYFRNSQPFVGQQANGDEIAAIRQYLCQGINGCIDQIMDLSPKSVAAFNLLQLITGGGDFAAFNVGVLKDKLDSNGKKILFKQDLDFSFMWFKPGNLPTYPCNNYMEASSVYDPTVLKWNKYKAWLAVNANIFFPSGFGSNPYFYPTDTKPSPKDINDPHNFFKCLPWANQGLLGFCDLNNNELSSRSLPDCVSNIIRELNDQMPLPPKSAMQGAEEQWCNFLIDVFNEMDDLRTQIKLTPPSPNPLMPPQSPRNDLLDTIKEVLQPSINLIQECDKIRVDQFTDVCTTPTQSYFDYVSGSLMEKYNAVINMPD